MVISAYTDGSTTAKQIVVTQPSWEDRNTKYGQIFLSHLSSLTIPQNDDFYLEFTIQGIGVTNVPYYSAFGLVQSSGEPLPLLATNQDVYACLHTNSLGVFNSITSATLGTGITVTTGIIIKRGSLFSLMFMNIF